LHLTANPEEFTCLLWVNTGYLLSLTKATDLPRGRPPGKELKVELLVPVDHWNLLQSPKLLISGKLLIVSKAQHLVWNARII
jgi:hypothetical protein